MYTHLLVCRHCIFNQWIAEGIDKKKSPFLFLMNPEFHNKRTVLTPSFRPKRSGVEKSHAEAGRAPWWQKISRLSVSINSKAYTPIPSAPLEMTIAAGRMQPFPRNLLTKTLPRPRHFDRSETEKSHADVGRAPWWQKISRLSVSINSKDFPLILAGPPLEMTITAGSLSSYVISQKGL